MKHNDLQNEVKSMTNKQTAGLLEALEIIVEMANDKETIIKAIKRIKDKIEEPTSTPK